VPRTSQQVNRLGSPSRLQERHKSRLHDETVTVLLALEAV
jgi:hypothetical protein